MRRRGARGWPRDLGLVGKFAAPVAAKGYRPGADTVFPPRRWKAPAVSDRLFRARLGAFGRMVMPPPAGGADEFACRSHRSRSSRSSEAFNHYLVAALNFANRRRSDLVSDGRRHTAPHDACGRGCRGCAGAPMLTMF